MERCSERITLTALGIEAPFTADVQIKASVHGCRRYFRARARRCNWF